MELGGQVQAAQAGVLCGRPSAQHDGQGPEKYPTGAVRQGLSRLSYNVSQGVFENWDGTLEIENLKKWTGYKFLNVTGQHQQPENA